MTCRVGDGQIRPKYAQRPQTQDWASRIEIDPKRLGGKPVVHGTRISVALVVSMIADGWDERRIVAEYPSLTPEDVRACLRYAAAMLEEERRFPLPAG